MTAALLVVAWLGAGVAVLVPISLAMRLDPDNPNDTIGAFLIVVAWPIALVFGVGMLLARLGMLLARLILQAVKR